MRSCKCQFIWQKWADQSEKSFQTRHSVAYKQFAMKINNSPYRNSNSALWLTQGDKFTGSSPMTWKAEMDLEAPGKCHKAPTLSAVLGRAIPNPPRGHTTAPKANGGTQARLADYLLLHPFLSRRCPRVLYKPYRICTLKQSRVNLA